MRPSAAPNYTLVTSNGQKAVLVNVRQALNGDTVQVVKRRRRRGSQRSGLPPSVKVTPFYDQSELVTGAANAVRDAILLGAVLAGLVLFLFLRSVRLMAITAVVLPAVLAATCLILFALGMHFDMMTLGGMAAAVGLIVDDAVVMLEHIMRRMQEGNGKRSARSLLAAAAEMAQAAVRLDRRDHRRLPAAGLHQRGDRRLLQGAGGHDGGRAGHFAALCALRHPAGRGALAARQRMPKRPRSAGGFMGRIIAGLRAGLATGPSRARRCSSPSSASGLRLAGLPRLVSNVPSGFMPKMDEGGFVLDYKAQPGAALSDTDRLLRQVEQIIQSTPEVASYSRRTGVQLGGGLTEADEGDYFIRLKGGSRRPIEAGDGRDPRSKIETQVPGLEVETDPADGRPDRRPHRRAPTDRGQAVRRRSGRRSTRRPGRSARRSARSTAWSRWSTACAWRAMPSAIKVDPGAALQQGLDPDAVASQLEALVGGTAATQVRVGEQLIDVRVRGPADMRQRAAQIAELPLTAPDGHTGAGRPDRRCLGRRRPEAADPRGPGAVHRRDRAARRARSRLRR